MKMFRICAVAAAFGCVSAMAAAPAGIKVSAEADSAVIVMGDRMHLRVVVDIPRGSESAVNLSELPLLNTGQDYLPWNGIDIVESDSASSVDENRRRISYDYTVQAFDPGTVSLPPFKITAGTDNDTAYSNVITFKVLPVEVDSLQQINPMAGIVAPDTRWYDYIPNWLGWVLLAIALIAMSVVAYLYYGRRKVVEEQRRSIPVPPYELAIARLDTLKARNLADNGHEREYYTELVDILRQYLQGRFGINAMEMTSSQIVRSLRANPDTRMTADRMRSILSIADFVKFAKVRPLPDDNIKAFTRAREFVEETKPAPEIVEPESADTPQIPNSTSR